jgi:hypothetical protein
MSEEKKDQSAIHPTKNTSAVPLRKETVRVTLKAPGAKPGSSPAGVETSKPIAPTPTMNLGSAPVPKALAVAPTIPLNTAASTAKKESVRVTLKADKDGKAPVGGPPAPPVAPAAPTIRVVAKTAPPAAAPAPTIPLGAKKGPPAPAPAPTIPLNTGAKPPVAAPAPTMKLGGAATLPLATQPLKAPGAGASQPLPKATVELQQTQQLTPTQGLGAPAQAASIQTVSEDDEATRGGAGPALALSIVAFGLSLLVLYFQFDHAKIWVDEHKDGDMMSIFDTAE